MKTKLLSLVLLITLTAGCQDYKKEIEITFTKYQNSANKDFKDFLNYIPDEYFSVYPKEKVLSAMEKEAKNPDSDSEPNEIKLIKIGDSELIDGKYYSLLTYSNKMKFKYNKKAEETEDDYKEMTNLKRMLWEAKYGQENVKFDETTYFFEIDSEEQSYAISNNGQTNWKFISTDEDRSILEKILPKQLIDRL